jgi:hypothetical protein
MYEEQESAMMNSQGKLREQALPNNRSIFTAETVNYTSAALVSKERAQAQVITDQTS